MMPWNKKPCFIAFGSRGAVQAVRGVASFQVIQPSTPVTTGFLIKDIDGTLLEFATFEYAMYPVTGGVAYKLTGHPSGASTALAVWYDSGGNFIESNIEGAPGEGVEYIDELLTAPVGAVTLGMTQKTERSLKMQVKEYSDGTALAQDVRILEQRSTINETVDATQDGALSSFREITSISGVIEGAIIQDNDGSVNTALTAFEYAFYPVTGGTRYKLTGHPSGASTALAVWYDGDTFISSAEEGLPGDGQVYNDFLITAPENATKLGMTQKIERTTEMRVLGESFDPDVAGRVEEHDARVVALETKVAARNSKWRGATIYGNGTSVPKGYSPETNYFEITCGLIGATLIDDTVYGGLFKSGWLEDVTGGDPNGWSGKVWAQVRNCFGMTIAEKQDLYDNFATYRTLFADAPATLDASDLADMLARSFENRLDLTASGPDLYMFGECWNDTRYDDEIDTGDDVDVIGAGTYDRKSYLGLMNYIIREIRQARPYVPIVLVGHHERDTYRGGVVYDAMQVVAETNRVPLIQPSDVLGWTQDLMTHDGTWVEDPGDSNIRTFTTGATSEDTVLNRYVPDSLHPGLDASGKAARAIAEVVADGLDTVPQYQAIGG